MSRELRVACVQLAARDVEERDRALEEAVAAAREAAGAADLVVLPEATFPGYVLHDRAGHADAGQWSRGRAAFSEVARASGATVVVGLVRPEGERLWNSGVAFDGSGEIVDIADKAFLWHFDNRWFDAGTPSEVWAISSGLAGSFVCADARMMEVPRHLARRGAELLVDCTALVLGPSGVNAQIIYMLAARAWENGAFLAVANKCGYEAGIAHYAGRSAIFAPSGERLAEASASEPEIIYAMVDLDEATGPISGPSPPLLRSATEDLEVARLLASPVPATPLRIAVVQRGGPARERMVRELGADLSIGWDEGGSQHLAVGLEGLRLGERTVGAGDVLDVAGSRLGVLTGDLLGVPEEARSLMLNGCSMIVWIARAGHSVPDFVIRTRADENRVFVLVMLDDGSWSLTAPTGAPLAAGPADDLAVVLVDVPLVLARYKEMAPGTDVVRGRPVVQEAASTERRVPWRTT